MFYLKDHFWRSYPCGVGWGGSFMYVNTKITCFFNTWLVIFSWREGTPHAKKNNQYLLVLACDMYQSYNNLIILLFVWISVLFSLLCFGLTVVKLETKNNVTARRWSSLCRGPVMMHGCKSARIIATFTLRKLQNSTNSPETQDDRYRYFHTQMIARLAQQTDSKGNTTILKLDSLLVDLGFGTFSLSPQRFSWSVASAMVLLVSSMLLLLWAKKCRMFSIQVMSSTLWCLGFIDLGTGIVRTIADVDASQVTCISNINTRGTMSIPKT